jgi:hypothetical protein
MRVELYRDYHIPEAADAAPVDAAAMFGISGPSKLSESSGPSSSSELSGSEGSGRSGKSRNESFDVAAVAARAETWADEGGWRRLKDCFTAVLMPIAQSFRNEKALTELEAASTTAMFEGRMVSSSRGVQWEELKAD